MEKKVKKVLVITYHWPPSGGISVLRSLKIVKYLRDFGWESIVYTVDNPQYPILDDSNLKHIPKGLTIIKRPIIEPFELFKKITGRKKDDTLQNILYIRNEKKGWLDKIFIWARGNFFIPDARSLWVKPSVKFLCKYLKDNPVDAIFSDGPPHTNTLIACRISQITNTPWLADFQDPWTQVDYYKDFMITNWADKRHKKLESECIKQANKITIVTDSWKKDLESIGAENVSVIPWGFDEDDYKNIKPKLSDKFLISHIGVLGTDRLPDIFLKVIGDLCHEIPDFRSNLKFKLIGSVDYELVKIAAQYGLEKEVELVRHVPRTEALHEIFNSQVLLLLINKAENAKGRMPAKLFEYLKAARPILCLGSKTSDVSRILEETKSGVTIDYDNYEALKKTISNYYQLYLDGKLAIEQKHIEQYSIKKLTGKIATYLDEIT